MVTDEQVRPITYPEGFWLKGVWEPVAEDTGSSGTGTATASCCRAFTASGLSICRSGSNRTYSVLQCGPFGYLDSPHSHADMLHLDVSLGCDNLLVDPGTLVYTGDLDARNRFRAPSAHNGPRIAGIDFFDPDDPFAWKQQPDCRIGVEFASPGFSYTEGGYQIRDRNYGLTGFLRAVLFLSDQLWIVRDYVTCERPSVVNWDFITEGMVRTDGLDAFIAGHRQTLAIRPVVPGVTNLTISVDSASVSDDYLSQRPGTRIKYATTTGLSAGVFWLMFPDRSRLESAAAAADSTSGTCSLMLQFDQCEHFLIMSDAGDKHLSDFSTDAQLIYLITRDGLIERLILGRGSYLRRGSDCLLECNELTNFVDLTRQGRDYFGCWSAAAAPVGPDGCTVRPYVK
jgi:hypothetical protein